MNQEERTRRKNRDHRMVELYRNGYPLSHVAQEYGMTRERARQIVQKQLTDTHGDNPLLRTKPVPKKSVLIERKARIKTLLAEGKTVVEIAEILGISRNLACKGIALLRKENDFLGSIPKQGKIDLVMARRMRDAGATLRTIAHYFGASVSSARTVLAKEESCRKNQKER